MHGDVVLLGPQRPRPVVGRVLADLGGTGDVVLITAGWRHEEPEIEPLAAEVGRRTVHLPLYSWFEQIGRRHPSLAALHQDRQRHIRGYKRLYRLRLQAAMDALRAIDAARDVPPSLVAEARARGLAHVIDLDTSTAARQAEIRDRFGGVTHPWTLPEVAPLHAEAAAMIRGASTVCIAGGHVGVLHSRLAFFGLAGLLASHAAAGGSVVAWSAGAMCITERIILFYDEPPEGPSDPEVLDRGLAIAPDIAVFPHPRLRLRLDDPDRIALLARRFGPSPCVGLEPGAWLVREGSRWASRGPRGSALRLHPSGQVVPFEEGP